MLLITFQALLIRPFWALQCNNGFSQNESTLRLSKLSYIMNSFVKNSDNITLQYLRTHCRKDISLGFIKFYTSSQPHGKFVQHISQNEYYSQSFSYQFYRIVTNQYFYKYRRKHEWWSWHMLTGDQSIEILVTPLANKNLLFTLWSILHISIPLFIHARHTLSKWYSQASTKETEMYGHCSRTQLPLLSNHYCSDS